MISPLPFPPEIEARFAEACEHAGILPDHVKRLAERGFAILPVLFDLKNTAAVEAVVYQHTIRRLHAAEAEIERLKMLVMDMEDM